MPTATDHADDSINAFQSLIDSIRREAVEEAEVEAGRVLKSAETQARQMLTKAKEEAARIIEEGRKEAERFETTSQDAVKRASRDALLGFEAALLAQLRVVLGRKTAEAMRGKELASILHALAENWRKNEPEAELESLLGPDDLDALQGLGQDELVAHLLAGVELKPSPDIPAGLRIGLKDGRAHYDFTAPMLAEWLGQFVGERLRALLVEAAAEATPNREKQN
tara:strand:- start:2192 stop:2863 length:672 start_codon:yes stop_codon:yes gene_type:complete